MKNKLHIALLNLAALHALITNCAAAERADALLAQQANLQKAAQSDLYSATAAVDYFHYDLDLAPGGQTGLGGSLFGQGSFKGDLYGTTLTFSWKNFYFDAGYHRGDIKGDVNYGLVSSRDQIDRNEGEVRFTYRQGANLFHAKGLGGWIGASYTFVNQDYTETLPAGFLWTATGTPVRTYSDQLHNFLGEAGLQYTFLLHDSGRLAIRFIPKAGGGFGAAKYGQDSTRPGIDTDLWQLAFKWQATGQLEFTVAARHTFFLEGGYKRVGFWQTEGNVLSQDYFGPFARVGYSIGF